MSSMSDKRFTSRGVGFAGTTSSGGRRCTVKERAVGAIMEYARPYLVDYVEEYASIVNVKTAMCGCM